MSRSHRRLTVLAFLLASTSVACGERSSFPPSEPSESNLGGDGIPVQIANEPIPHRSEQIDGVMRLHETGCWAAAIDTTELLVIFPLGFAKPNDNGLVMRSSDGVDFGDGTSFTGRGAVVPIDVLPGIPDGFLGGYLGFCDPEARQVIVMDSMRPVSDEEGTPES